jgi:hypothetical protein
VIHTGDVGEYITVFQSPLTLSLFCTRWDILLNVSNFVFYLFFMVEKEESVKEMK